MEANLRVEGPSVSFAVGQEKQIAHWTRSKFADDRANESRNPNSHANLCGVELIDGPESCRTSHSEQDSADAKSIAVVDAGQAD